MQYIRYILSKVEIYFELFWIPEGDYGKGKKVKVGVYGLVPGKPAYTTLHDLPSLAIWTFFNLLVHKPKNKKKVSLRYNNLIFIKSYNVPSHFLFLYPPPVSR